MINQAKASQTQTDAESRVTSLPAYTKDTIVAIATPSGKGGIGIVRVSGSEVERIANSMLGKLPTPRYATSAAFFNQQGQAIDRGIALYFPAPDSFTGETVLELQGHGGPIVMSALVDAVIALGARRAEPGEFSRRAFLNGKLDLAQAEAIVDLIDSGTQQAANAALRSLSGEFSKSVEALQEQIVRLRIHVEAAIDFPEEEIDYLADDELHKAVDLCDKAFRALQESTGIGRVLRDGFQVVILGKPNAGKSSLLNHLSGQDAAIVTEVAGTTRDILREQISIDGLLVELIDTAGLRDDPDIIEAEGIRRALAAQQKADAILWIKDVQDVDAEPDARNDVPLIVLRNKIDLSDEKAGLVTENPPVVNGSAKTGAGIDVLRNVIGRIAGYKNLGEGAFTARQRHVDALSTAEEHFSTGREALLRDKAGEIFAEELRLAQDALGAITGAVSSDELLGRIFSEFCLGK